jgi:chromate transporter
LAVAQSTPGALAVNMATFVGFRIRGLIGAVAAALGCVLPSFVIILIIAMFFSRFMDVKLIQRAFMGIRPAVAALIAFSVVKIARTSKIKLMWYSVAALAAAAILLLKMDPIVIIILSALIGLSSWVIGLIKGRGGRNEDTN